MTREWLWNEWRRHRRGVSRGRVAAVVAAVVASAARLLASEAVQGELGGLYRSFLGLLLWPWVAAWSGAATSAEPAPERWRCWAAGCLVAACAAGTVVLG